MRPVKRKAGNRPAMSIPTMFEALEPRLFLDAAPAVEVIGSPPAGTQGTIQKAGWYWTDVDGDKVTPTYTGPTGSYVVLYFDNADPNRHTLQKVELHGTTTLSSLNLAVTKYLGSKTPLIPAGNGIVEVGQVTSAGTANLGTLNLGSTFITGNGIDMQGVVKTLTLKTVDDGAILSFGGQWSSTVKDTMALTADMLGDNVSLNFGGTVNITANSWGVGGTISAYGSTTITINNGEFGPDMSFGAGGFKALTVKKGGVTGSLINSIGPAGTTIAVTGGSFNPSIDVDGNVGAITVTGGDLVGSVNSAGGNIGNLTVSGGMLADITAPYGSIGILKAVTGIAGQVHAKNAVGAITVTKGDIESDIISDAASIGAITVTNGGIDGAISAAANIGNIAVTGGDVTGAITSVSGAIGNITIKATAIFVTDPDVPALGQGESVGGNLLSPTITAGGATLGKSIGTIALTGGAVGTADAPVVIDAPGDIGGLTISKFTYKLWVGEQVVLDANGNPVLDASGNPVTQKITYNWIQGGGAWLTLDTAGKMGAINMFGGDLAGTLHAAKGFSTIAVQGIINKQSATVAGLPTVDSDQDCTTADLTADLSSEPGATLTGIASITVVGGSMLGNVTTNGKVGAIVASAYGVRDLAVNALTPYGGGFASESFHAASIASVALTGGSFTATVITTDRIGTIAVTGGGMTGDITATNAIGAVTVKTVTVNAALDHSDDTSTSWTYNVLAPIVLGGDADFTVHLGGTGAVPNRSATFGLITCVGCSLTLNGEVPWDPALKLTKPVISKVTYISDYTLAANGKSGTPINTVLAGGTPTINLTFV